MPTPTLLVWGEDDHIVPPTFGQVYADAFPNSRFETIPGAGHITTRPNPAPTSRLGLAPAAASANGPGKALTTTRTRRVVVNFLCRTGHCPSPRKSVSRCARPWPGTCAWTRAPSRRP
ncbi:alpha/beta fold hydrolase [Dactylosporangium sp. CA-233914]|uniref:alpha/beta fold hydrolase n=1 Tax=Dactylosporangium sp. CA-233914 TaxID=3239934 RepID=UPI003D8FA264